MSVFPVGFLKTNQSSMRTKHREYPHNSVITNNNIVKGIIL